MVEVVVVVVVIQWELEVTAMRQYVSEFNTHALIGLAEGNLKLPRLCWNLLREITAGETTQDRGSKEDTTFREL